MKLKINEKLEKKNNKTIVGKKLEKDFRNSLKAAKYNTQNIA